MMEYHAAIKKDAAIHLTQQDGHGVVKWKSYKTVCTSWSHLKISTKACKSLEGYSPK